MEEAVQSHDAELEGATDDHYQDQDASSGEESRDEQEDSESEDEGLGEVERYWPPPVTENFEIKANHSSKTIAALTFNQAGTRFAAGGHDNEVHIWDFQALDPSNPRSICSSQPCGQTVVKNLDYSSDDELILVISGGCQAIIVSKDGLVVKQYQCPKGDQYISDMSNTKGHVQMLNDGCWNVKDKQNFITCSNDGTVRIWDLNKLSQQKTVIKTRSPVSGLKSLPNVCKYSRDSLSIIAGCSDGSVLMWDTRRKFISTSANIKNAHLKGSEITGIDFSYGSNKLCTRSEDETCKVWDLRKLKEPIGVRTELATIYSTTDCSFSPDDKFIITGSSKSKQEPGQLHFLSVEKELESQMKLEVGEASVIRSKWHPKINHIVYSCSDGRVCVAYDKRKSLAGCLADSSGSRGLKRKKYVQQQQRESKFSPHSTSITKIITPHALPLFRDDAAASSFAKIRQDPKRSYKPEMPIAGVSQGGRVKPAGSTLSSYIARNIAKPVDAGGLDIRERILRHADEAARDPRWIRPVGGDQQPPQQSEKNQAKPSMQQPQQPQPQQQQQQRRRQQQPTNTTQQEQRDERNGGET